MAQFGPILQLCYGTCSRYSAGICERSHKISQPEWIFDLFRRCSKRTGRCFSRRCAYGMHACSHVQNHLDKLRVKTGASVADGGVCCRQGGKGKRNAVKATQREAVAARYVLNPLKHYTNCVAHLQANARSLPRHQTTARGASPQLTLHSQRFARPIFREPPQIHEQELLQLHALLLWEPQLFQLSRTHSNGSLCM